MNKILLIIQREYLSRVKKKSFLLTTFIVPILFIGMYIGIIYLTKKSYEDTHATVRIVDDEGTVSNLLKSNKNVTFEKAKKELKEELMDLSGKKENANVLLIPKDFFEKQTIEILSAGKPNMGTQDEVKSQLSGILLDNAYKKLGVDTAAVKNINTDVYISAKEITDEGEEKDSDTRVAIGIAVGLSILIYMSIFLYGVQVMRGVIEEKTSRIVEVIISSVKPFQLMMGKIIGIGMVGVTQFLLWIVLSLSLLFVATSTLMDKEDIQTQMAQSSPISNQQIMSQTDGFDINVAMQSVNLPELIICFLLFFLGGYLLYSALFAAAGSAVDSETEANQFTMPITMPLLVAYALSFGVLINDPHGPIATWLSFIPFTSPIAMLVRVPFGVPLWEIALSYTILIATFIFITYVASRIYRVGILMYGKKASYKEMIKWFKYKS